MCSHCLECCATAATLSCSVGGPRRSDSVLRSFQVSLRNKHSFRPQIHQAQPNSSLGSSILLGTLSFIILFLTSLSGLGQTGSMQNLVLMLWLMNNHLPPVCVALIVWIIAYSIKRIISGIYVCIPGLRHIRPCQPWSFEFNALATCLLALTPLH